MTGGDRQDQNRRCGTEWIDRHLTHPHDAESPDDREEGGGQRDTEALERPERVIVQEPNDEDDDGEDPQYAFGVCREPV